MNIFSQFVLGGFNGRSGQSRHNYGGFSNTRKVQYCDNLQVYPAYQIDRPDLEKGNKILLPPSVLNQLSAGQLPYPMIFCLQNTMLNKQTYVGVLEFIAPEESCYIPFWIFQMLQCFEGQQIQISLVTDIQKGRFVKIQPHETNFIDLPNPRAILEKELRNFTVLTQGDTIHIEFMKQHFSIDILEVKPQNDYNAICVVDAEIEVDFAKPLDYIDNPLPTMIKKESSIVIEEENKSNKPQIINFTGKAMRIDGKTIDEKKLIDKKEENLEFDPRKHRLQNGVRRTITEDQYTGQSILIGKSGQNQLISNKK